MKRGIAIAAAVPVLLAAGCAAQEPIEAEPVAKFAPMAKKPRLNNKKPASFKRYNAPGVTNVNKYLYPRREYMGVFTQYKKSSPVAGAKAFGKLVGKQPTIIKGFYNFGDPFDKKWAASLWKAGAMPQMELEAWPKAYNQQATLKKIAAGQGDAYITKLADDIKAAKIPIIFSFAHEFNADWYPWGNCSRPQNQSPATENACDYKSSPADFVGAWKRMHDIFWKRGATNAIWMWQPNQIGARPEIKLKPYWPGNSYVDWVGVVGYYLRGNWSHTFNQIFVPTFKEVRKFTKRPIIIPEVGSVPGSRRAKDVKDFLAGVNTYPNVIGFIWFNKDKRPQEKNGDFRLETSRAGVTAFKAGLKKGYFGVKVK